MLFSFFASLPPLDTLSTRTNCLSPILWVATIWLPVFNNELTSDKLSEISTKLLSINTLLMSKNPFKIGDSVYLKSDDMMTIHSIDGDTCTCTWKYGGKNFTADFKSELLEKPSGSIGIQMVGDDEGIQIDFDEKNAE